MAVATTLGPLMSFRLLPKSALLLIVLLVGGSAQAELYYLIVGGLGGEPNYEEQFAAHSLTLANAAKRTVDEANVTVLTGDDATRDAVRASLEELAANTQASDRLAVMLIGHGSYDGRQYKFNLPGPDLDDGELGELLTAVPARTQLIVNATSASGAILENWASEGRSIITATRSGAERNATRFAGHWAAALSSAAADLNKNGSISVQEAYDYASRAVADSFEAEGTLATEHPQLAGEGAAAFEVARLTARALDTPELVTLNAELVELEEQIAALRLQREELGEDYLPQLQALLVQLALVQQRIDAAAGE